MMGKGNLFLLFGILISFVTAQNWWETGISVKLTPQDFDDVVGKDRHVVVNYFAQYCWHCMNMAPEYNKLAEQYMGEHPKRKDIVITKVDGGYDMTLANRYGVNAFPSILFFKKNENTPSSRYNGPRMLEYFTNWIETQAGIEEIPPEKIEIDTEIFEKNDAQMIEDIPNVVELIQQDSNLPSDYMKGEREHDEFVNHNIDMIVQKLDFLVDFTKTNTNNQVSEQEGKAFNELKELISDVNKKVDNKIPTPPEDINFSHGISFLVIGVFLGIGVSFVIINIKKLNNSKNFLD